mgnify:CR=1 FL=1
MNPGIFLKQFHISLPGIKRKMEHFALSNTYVILILHIYAPTQKNCIAIQLDPNLLFGELDQTADDFHIQVDSPRQTLFSYKSASLLENSAELRSWVTRTSPVNACGWTVTLERPEKNCFCLRA